MKSYLIATCLSLATLLPALGQADSALMQKNNVQIRLPTYFKGFPKDFLYVGMKYERLLKPKLSIGVYADYRVDNSDYQGYQRKIFESKHLSLKPTLIYYLRNKAKSDRNYRGVFLGISSLFGLQRYDQLSYYDYNQPDRYEIVNQKILGIGPRIGYQQLIKKRLSIEASASIHYFYIWGKYESIERKERRNYGNNYFLDAGVRVGYVF